jgi:ferredoxin
MDFMAWNIDNNKCLRCGGCVSVCPTAALELRDIVIYDEKLCTLCGVCEKACPADAIKVTKP